MKYINTVYEILDLRFGLAGSPVDGLTIVNDLRAVRSFSDLSVGKYNCITLLILTGQVHICTFQFLTAGRLLRKLNGRVDRLSRIIHNDQIRRSGNRYIIDLLENALCNCKRDVRRSKVTLRSCFFVKRIGTIRKIYDLRGSGTGLELDRVVLDADKLSIICRLEIILCKYDRIILRVNTAHIKQCAGNLHTVNILLADLHVGQYRLDIVEHNDHVIAVLAVRITLYIDDFIIFDVECDICRNIISLRSRFLMKRIRSIRKIMDHSRL